ncbi:hypothetical protein [Actinophytocola sp.]|uniref:hypothetical protein n=1 Tax=Actinophytocola sp. TaxID=1872138 RepID=UPI00389AB1BB
MATAIEHRTGRVFRLLIRAGLGAFIVFYATAVFINRELGLVDKIERPLIMAALLLILAVLARIERHLSRGETPEVTVYTNRHSFYTATRKTVENCQDRIFVCYLSPISPNEVDASFQQHIDACRKWAKSSPRHRFRRIGVNSDDPSMIEFLKRELTEVRRARVNQLHYRVKLLDRTTYDAAMFCVGIYDDDQVFISCNSDTDRIVGIGIRGREVVRECFDHYYDCLWHSAVDIEKFPIDEVPARVSPTR